MKCHQDQDPYHLSQSLGVHNAILLGEHAIMHLCIWFATFIYACVDLAMAIWEIGDDDILYNFGK